LFVWQVREISKICKGKKQSEWSKNTTKKVERYLQSFFLDPMMENGIKQQLMIFHFGMAQLLEELSPCALYMMQNSQSMAEVVCTLQDALVERSRTLSIPSLPSLI